VGQAGQAPLPFPFGSRKKRCDQKKKEWGSFYVFRSEKALNEFVNSDRWQKVTPQKYGCIPQWVSLEVGAIISKKVITTFEGSWENE
jgi:hypothetical protein